MRNLIGLVGICLVSGCSLLFDVSDYTVVDEEGGPDSGGTDSGSDAGPACPSATHRCVPAPPSPWTGPVAVTTTASTCGGAFPTANIDLFGDLQIPASSCGCACGTPTQTCPTTFRVTGYSGTSCNGGVGADTITTNQCYTNTAVGSIGIDFNTNSTGASCGPGTVSDNIVDARFDSDLRACGGFTDGPGSCVDGGRCVPQPAAPFAAGRLCVFAAGDMACPTGYPDRTLLAAGLTDNRSCPATCGCTSSGANCSSSITRYTSATNCSGSTGSSITLNVTGSEVCTGNTAVFRSIRPRPVIATRGTCTAQRTSIIGEVTANGPHTVCCQDG